MSLMNPDDQELFLEMLLKLDGTHESIKAASKWCRANATHHEDIVRMWFFAIAKSRTMTRRLDLFHLASDILFTVEASSVQYFSSFVPQLIKAIPFVRGEEIKIPMKKLFTLWREKNIYNKDVMDVFEKSLRNRNKVVDMAIFQYDRDLLFKNLRRVQDLRPACDYLMKGLESSPNFENSLMLASIKERRACHNLLSAVDAYKGKVTSLVTYMEEMVHLLKMATAALDLAANREQNGVEETKLKIVAYGRHSEKILSLSHTLESKFKIVKADLVKPSPASPEPEPEDLYSRRGDVSGPNWQPPLPSVPLVDLNIDQLSIDKPTAPEIFTRRETRPGSLTPMREQEWATDAISAPMVHRVGTPRREEWADVPSTPVVHRVGTPRREEWVDVPSTPVVHRAMTPRREEWASDALLPTPVVHRAMTPVVHRAMTPRREEWPLDVPRGSTTPRRDPEWNLELPPPPCVPKRTEPRAMTPRREEDWAESVPRSESWPGPPRGSLTPRRDEEWNAVDLFPRPPQRPRGPPRPKTTPWAVDVPRGSLTPQRDEDWTRDRRSVTPSREEWPRRSMTPARDDWAVDRRDEWPDRRRSLTPARDEWSPASPLHTGASSWGPSTSGRRPVYMPHYTGVHHDVDDAPSHVGRIPSLLDHPIGPPNFGRGSRSLSRPRK